MNKSLLRAQFRAVLPRGMVMHASSVVINGKAQVFLARSGGGKSSIRRSLSLLDGDYGAIADDSLVISTGTDGTTRCLPCASIKQYTRCDRLRGAELGRFVFLEKGTPECLFRVSRTYGRFRAIASSSLMAFGLLNRAEQDSALEYLSGTFSRYPLYILRWNIKRAPLELLCDEY